MKPLHERVQTDGGEPPHSVALNRGLARRLIAAARLVASNTPLLDGVHSLCIPASYKSVRLRRLRSLAPPGGLATFGVVPRATVVPPPREECDVELPH